MPAVAQNSRGQNAAGQSQSGTTQEAKAPPLYQIKPGEWRASKLDGLDVYNTNNEKIGDISELILDRSGKIQAVVIGVGGFLGMGEHKVAVPFEQVQWVDQPVEHRTSSNDRTNAGNGTGGIGTSGIGTSGSGSSTASTSDNAGADRDRAAGMNAANAPPPGPAQVNAPVAGVHPDTAPAGGAAPATVAPTQTRVDPGTGAMVTTTAGGNAAATGGDHSATTGGDRTNASDRMANRDNNRNDTTRTYRPDHAVVAMTKDQVKALSEVRYAQ